MTTFVQNIEGAQGVGIGNQRVVQEQTPSFAPTAQAISAGLANAYNLGGEIVADYVADGIVESAGDALEKERARIEDTDMATAIPQGNIADLTKTTNLLRSGVTRGTMSKEKARLFVTNEVTKAIQDQPLFQDKIRNAAQDLLGFNLQSEASKAYFSSFPSEAAIASARGGSSGGALEKQAQFLVDSGIVSNMNDARFYVGQNLMAQLGKETADLRFQNNITNAEQSFGEVFAADTTALHHNIFASALRDKNNNVEINEKYWRQKINENKLIKQGEVLNRYAGKVDSATIERFQRQYDTAYENVYQAIKDMDTNMLTEDALARQATADRTFGAKSFEKIRFYRNAFGDRGLNNILDIIAKVQSEPEYRALISRDPAFAPLLQLEGVEPGTFSRVLDEALALTIDPTKGKKDMTSEQQAALDLYLQQSARQSSDEEADSITKGLQSSDQEKKAFSYVVNRGRANATPEGIKVFNNRWNSFAADARQDLVDAIIDNRQPIDLFVTPEGLDARITRDRAGRQVDTAPAVNSELGQIIAEYNKFKQAYDTGWKNDMKVKNYDVLLEDVVRVVEQQASPVIDNLELIDTLNSGRLGSGRSRGLRSQDDNDAVNAFNALSGNEKELILPYLTQTARSKIGNIIITDSDAQLMEEFNASDPLDREAMRREAGLE